MIRFHSAAHRCTAGSRAADILVDCRLHGLRRLDFDRLGFDRDHVLHAAGSGGRFVLGRQVDDLETLAFLRFHRRLVWYRRTYCCDAADRLRRANDRGWQVAPIHRRIARLDPA